MLIGEDGDQRKTNRVFLADDDLGRFGSGASQNIF